MKEHPIFTTQISETLAGDSAGLDGAWLAWNFSKAITEANRMLEEASTQLSSGDTLTPFIHLMGAPNVFKRAEGLKVEDSKSWNECCEYFGWTTSKGLKNDLIDVFQSVFLKGDEARQLLLTEYHSRMSSSKTLEALAVIKILEAEHPKEDAYKADLLRLNKRLAAELDADLMEISAGVVSGTTAEEVYFKYEQGGFDEMGEGNLVSSVRETISKSRYETWTKKLSETHSMISDSSKWKACEGLYFEVRYNLENGCFSELATEADKKKLKETKEALSRFRGEHDLELQIKDADEEFSGSNLNRKEKQALINRITDLVGHGKKLGYSLDYSILDRVNGGKGGAQKKQKSNAKAPKPQPAAKPAKVAKKETEKAEPTVSSGAEDKKGSKMPLFIGGGIAAAIAIGFVVMSGGSDSVDVASTSKSVPAKEAPAKKEEAKSLTIASKEKLGSKSTVANKVESPENDVVAKEAVLVVAEAEPIVTKVAPKPVVVETKTTFVEADHLVDQMATVVRLGYSKEGVTEIARIESDIQKLLSKGGELDIETVDKIGKLKIEFSALSGDRIQELATIANYWVSKCEDSIETLKPLVSEEDVEKGLSKTKGAVASARGAIQKVKALGGEFDTTSFDECVVIWEEKDAGLKAYQSARSALAQVSDLDGYYKNLEHFQSFEILPDSSRLAIVETLHSRVSDIELLQPLLLPRGKSAWIDINDEKPYSERVVKLSSDERSQLSELVNDSYSGNVYVSKVSNYQGESKPAGEYSVYLSKPIPDLSKKRKQAGNLAFEEYGFDKNGIPETVPNDLTLLVMDASKAYGYFYEKSVLTPESKYYSQVIQPSLKKLVKGAQRKVAIELIEDLNVQNELSPAFRVYWKKTVASIMKLDSWKWGVDFSPSLQAQIKQLGRSGASTLTKYTWMTESELASPNKKWATCLKDDASDLASKEIDAFVSLLKLASSGTFVPVGHGEREGTLEIHSKEATQGTLYLIDRKSGRATPFSEGMKLAEFAPVFAYVVNGAEVGDTIQKTSQAVSLDLATPAFKSLLPPLFTR